MDMLWPRLQPILLEAGEAVMEVYLSGQLGESEKSDSSPLTAADMASNEILQNGLSGISPHSIISEEDADTAPSSLPSNCWLIDPLDGTKNFIQHDGQFSIMVGMLMMGSPYFGAVYRPVTHEMFFAQKGEGAFLSIKGGEPIKLNVSEINSPSDIRAILSKNHLSSLEQDFIARAQISHVSHMGSIGIKLGQIAKAQSDLYATFGSLGAWDLCAPQIILSEAGGEVYGLDGKAIQYSSRKLKQGVLATNSQNKKLYLDAAAAVWQAAKKV